MNLKRKWIKTLTSTLFDHYLSRKSCISFEKVYIQLNYIVKVLFNSWETEKIYIYIYIISYIVIYEGADTKPTVTTRYTTHYTSGHNMALTRKKKINLKKYTHSSKGI